LPSVADSGAVGLRLLAFQLARFALSGGLVTAFMFATVTGLVAGAGVPAQAALVVAYVGGIVLNFSLNRQFVFVSGRGYAHRLSAQGLRFLAVALASYGLTALALAVLPGWLGVPELAVYLVTAAALALVSFLVLRHWVFRPTAPPGAAA
jgi:putative flippase GtrA